MMPKAIIFSALLIELNKFGNSQVLVGQHLNQLEWLYESSLILKEKFQSFRNSE